MGVCACIGSILAATTLLGFPLSSCFLCSPVFWALFVLLAGPDVVAVSGPFFHIELPFVGFSETLLPPTASGCSSSLFLSYPTYCSLSSYSGDSLAVSYFPRLKLLGGTAFS